MESIGSLFVFLAVFPIGWILGKIAWLLWAWGADELRRRRQRPTPTLRPVETTPSGYWGVGMLGAVKTAPPGAMWLEDLSPYPGQLVCVRCRAPWHEACGACAMEDHPCKLTERTTP